MEMKAALFILLISVLLLGCTGKKESEVDEASISMPIPVGAFSLKKVTCPCGIGMGEWRFEGDQALDEPKHYLANSVWFSGGFIEYEIGNPLAENDIKSLALLLDASSVEEITIYINGVEVASFKYNGNSTFIDVREDGTYLGKENPIKISEKGLEDVEANNKSLNLRIAVDSESTLILHSLKLQMKYNGERIYQPNISEIIEKPKDFEGKPVILIAHPGGWSCPPGKSTPLPEGFSRSATMIYDETGCLYVEGRILIGKILTELHSINIPGNETLVVMGKVKTDDKGVPFLAE